jgi:S-DNA-T family DNA segregation ATPase FtsK/SpoIIIE
MSFERTGHEPRPFLPQSLEDRLSGWLLRGLGSVLLAMAVAGWVSLATWSALDPSLTHATAGATRNWLGPAGAVLSDLLLQTLGFVAIFVFLAVGGFGVEFIYRERVDAVRYRTWLLPLSILVLAGAFSSLPSPATWPLSHGLGGMIGDVAFNFIAGIFAVANPQRAGIATGFLLFTAGMCLFSATLGLTQREWRFLMARDPRRGSKGLWAWARRYWSSGETPRAQGNFDRDGYGARAGHDAGYDQSPLHLEVPFPNTEVGPPGLMANDTVDLPGFDAPAAPALQRPDPRRSLRTPRPAAWQAGHPPRPPGDDPYAEAEFGASHAGRDDDSMPVMRDDDFDALTDQASRNIAHRFAPKGGIEAAAGSSNAILKPAAVSSVAPRKVGKGLIPFRPPAPAPYRRPSLNILKRAVAQRSGAEFTQPVLRGSARLLEDVLGDFGIKGEIKDIRPGPVVTLFEFEPARGIKSSRIVALSDDIARSMSATSARVAVVPGRNAIGIELPNVRRDTVYLRELLESDAWRNADGHLPVVLGKGIGGEPVIADLARMPHLLVAGTTGSGKSVGVNSMILSLLYRLGPSECRFLMIDPKMLELSVYNGIPHLLAPVVTDPHRAAAALAWAVTEMEERYKRMSQLGVRNIEIFNNRVRNAKKRGERVGRTVQTGFDESSGRPIYVTEQIDNEPMPYIVIVVDEFADLMVVAGKEVEGHVQRLAQMARAAGIHLIMATQRPSVDVVTGTIKANFPTRIAFKVASKIDSRTILNEQGAEQLLGAGDMLFSPGSGQAVRVHGPFVSDEEVERVAAGLVEQGEPNFVEALLRMPVESDEPRGPAKSGANEGEDLFDRAVAIVHRDQKASTSYIQRRLSIGYNRAADLIERMEREGIVSAADSVGRRRILIGGPEPDQAVG